MQRRRSLGVAGHGRRPREGRNVVTPINNFQTQAARFYEKANVLNSVLDRLTYFDAQKGELVPWIASKFTASEDQTRFTFTIRPA